jgi:hypothetical protein
MNYAGFTKSIIVSSPFLLSIVLVVSATQAVWIRRDYLSWVFVLSSFALLYALILPYDYSFYNKICLGLVPFIWLLLVFSCDIWFYFRRVRLGGRENFREPSLTSRLIFIRAHDFGATYDRNKFAFQRVPNRFDWICSYVVILGFFILVNIYAIVVWPE